MAECRNPECRGGRTPGVITSGKGTPNAPVIGASMRWGWVNCLACSITEAQQKAGAKYKHVNRSSHEIADRARLADSKAQYVQAPPQTAALQAIAAKTPAPPASPPVSGDVVQKLLDQNAKLSEQISQLLEDNRDLRHRLENRTLPSESSRVRKVHKKTRKKGARVNGSDSDED